VELGIAELAVWGWWDMENVKKETRNSNRQSITIMAIPVMEFQVISKFGRMESLF
jgi:hypothetical protein